MESKGNFKRTARLKLLLGQTLRSRSHPALSEIRELARRNSWKAFLFGGVPRGIWVSGRASHIRDYDIVFSDESFAQLEGALGSKIIARNRFGGIKLLLNDTQFDIWPLSKTWAFREKLVGPATFENLPLTTFLNVDSIITELAPQRGRKRAIYEAGFYRGIKYKLLDICLEQNPYPALCVARALRLAYTFDLSLSNKLCQYIINFANTPEAEGLEPTQKKHYGRVLFSKEDFSQIIEKLYQELGRRSDAGGIFLFERLPQQTYFWNYRVGSGRLAFA